MEKMITRLPSQLREALNAWPAVEPILAVPRTDAQYRQLVKLLDQLIDEVGENENHPLASLMEIIGVLIEKYEDEHVAALDTERQP
jgi:HTH-type transcriptional regulator/antitoxin HigA